MSCNFSLFLSNSVPFLPSLLSLFCFLLVCLYLWNSLLLYNLEERNYITPNTQQTVTEHYGNYIT